MPDDVEDGTQTDDVFVDSECESDWRARCGEHVKCLSGPSSAARAPPHWGMESP